MRAVIEAQAQLGGDTEYMLVHSDDQGLTLQDEPKDEFSPNPPRVSLSWEAFDALTAFAAQVRKPASAAE